MRFRVVGTDTTKYFVDPLGRLNWSASKESIDTLKLDDAGRPWVEISCRLITAGGSYQCFRDSSVYDIRNLRTKLTVKATNLWSDTASFHYNLHLQLDTLTNFSGEKEVFTFGKALHDSTRKLVALNNLLLTHNRVAYTPWGANGAVTFSDASLGQQIGLAYGFDSTSRTVRYSRGALSTPDTIRFFVDSGGRLSQAADTTFTWDPGACAVGPFGVTCDASKINTQAPAGTPASFFYDLVGNRKDSPSAGYIDSGNQLRRLALIRMTYDLDGNLVLKRTLKATDTTKTVRTDSLFWNALGQLDSIHGADSLGVNTLKIRWGYDGRGRQVRQSVGADTIRFVWDGDTRIVKTDKQGARKAYWTYYPGTQIPQSVAFTTPSAADTTLYYITDALHNTVALLKSNNGNWVLYGQLRYGAYGDSLAATGPGVGVAQFRYKGAYYDGYTRLYRMGSRYYDPDVGRFISEDPLGIDAGINQYAFADGDPVNGYDPSGNFCIPCAAAVLLYGSITYAEVAAGAAIGAALFTALEVSVAATQLSALSAMIEDAAGGRPLEQGFGENFVATAIFLSGQAWIGTAAGIYHSAGVNGIQPYVRLSPKPSGALTAGLSAGFYDRLGADAGTRIINATLKAHELGHTLQYLGLSALGKKWHPWVSYAVLGAPGMIGIKLGGVWQKWLHSFSPWENMASGFGKMVTVTRRMLPNSVVWVAILATVAPSDCVRQVTVVQEYQLATCPGTGFTPPESLRTGVYSLELYQGPNLDDHRFCSTRRFRSGHDYVYLLRGSSDPGYYHVRFSSANQCVLQVGTSFAHEGSRYDSATVARLRQPLDTVAVLIARALGTPHPGGAVRRLELDSQEALAVWCGGGGDSVPPGRPE